MLYVVVLITVSSLILGLVLALGRILVHADRAATAAGDASNSWPEPGSRPQPKRRTSAAWEQLDM